MLILALDTTGEHGGAALYRDFDCLASARSDTAAGYSVTLFQMVDRLFEHAGTHHAGSPIGLRDVDLFAVANGPGSFTGIRTGLAAAQAWARVFGRPVAAVSVLEAMVEEAQPQTDLAVPVLDARRDEFYLGTFRWVAAEGNSHLVAAGPGLVLRTDALGRFLDEHLSSGVAVTCVAREHDQRAQALRTALPESLRWADVPDTLLSAVARLALEARRKGRVQSVAALDAYYIRRSDAELKWKG